MGTQAAFKATELGTGLVIWIQGLEEVLATLSFWMISFSLLDFGLVSTLICLLFQPRSLTEPCILGCHVQLFMWGLELFN